MSHTKAPIDHSLLERMSTEIAPEVSPLMRFLLDNSRSIAAGIVICALAAAGFGVYSWHTGKQVADAQTALGRILVLKDNADRLAKLEAFKTDAPATVRPAVTLAIANAAMQVQNYAVAVSAWKELGADPKSALYITAIIGQAECLAAQGKTPEAIVTLERASIAADSTAVYLVNSILANLAEKNGDIEKAIAACDKIAAAIAAANPDEATFWRQKAASLRNTKSAS